MSMEGLNVGLDSEDKQKRIESIMEHTKEEYPIELKGYVRHGYERTI